jgi:drug/metabolite transporter (DMT)-like permease
MDEATWSTMAVTLMGLGGVVGGLVGIGLPEGRRLGALFALVAGAGVGLASVGLLTLLRTEGEPSASTFFFASLLGFATVCVAGWTVWRRSATERAAGPASD